MDFLIVVEAKLHSNPIKRELVQILQSKAQSVGAHKAVMVSTAAFQSGAIAFATTHRIALVRMTEGRYTFETRALTKPPPMTREQARALLGLPTFVGIHIWLDDTRSSASTTVIDTGDAGSIQRLLLDVPLGGSPFTRS
jgi:hypothetical protein